MKNALKLSFLSRIFPLDMEDLLNLILWTKLKPAILVCPKREKGLSFQHSTGAEPEKE